MVVKAVGFIESVQYLKKLLPNTPAEPAAQAIRMQVRK
jgi:hypothetical protein